MFATDGTDGTAAESAIARAQSVAIARAQSVYLDRRILRAVQLSRVFSDSKCWVDMPMRTSPEQVTLSFEALVPDPENPDLQQACDLHSQTPHSADRSMCEGLAARCVRAWLSDGAVPGRQFPGARE